VQRNAVLDEWKKKGILREWRLGLRCALSIQNIQEKFSLKKQKQSASMVIEV